MNWFHSTSCLCVCLAALLLQLLQQTVSAEEPQKHNSVTVLVATHDSSPSAKQSASFVADGHADQEEINAALAALPSIGGIVQLAEGTYDIRHAPGTLGGVLISRSNVVLAGSGPSTVLKLAADQNTNVVRIIGDAVQHVVIRDLQIDANRAENSAGQGDPNISHDRFEFCGIKGYCRDPLPIQLTGNILSDSAIRHRRGRLIGVSQNASQQLTTDSTAIRFRVRVDRGADVGQCFGSLFEATSDDGRLTIGAGFPNAYNTRLRADRHALQFYVRDNEKPSAYQVTPLPRPNELCGTYLHSRDDQLFSTYDGLRQWNETSAAWQSVKEVGGTGETLRIGNGILQFGDSRVLYENRTILNAPDRGTYQLFFYANGYLCFYHVNRGELGYRPYTNDADGFSRLIACPWTPEEKEVDLSRAITLNLPVVGETTFAWGVWGQQIVTGSNIGGFYVFADDKWATLRQPEIKTSFQLYSSVAFHDRLLMGQYPTGRLFAYDGEKLSEQANWPPTPDGVSKQAREAQTTSVYGGELVVGVWPWGELWRMNPTKQKWTFAQRMFDHPAPTPELIHPYDVENQHNPVTNLWGQRVTSLIPLRGDLFVSTSAKAPVPWDADNNPFLAPDLWQSYGQVYRLSAPGHLSVPTSWTEGATTFEMTLTPNEITIDQDGVRIGWQPLSGDYSQQWSQRVFSNTTWGQGIYGPANAKLEPL